jgi:hypothetical protein
LLLAVKEEKDGDRKGDDSGTNSDRRTDFLRVFVAPGGGQDTDVLLVRNAQVNQQLGNHPMPWVGYQTPSVNRLSYALGLSISNRGQQKSAKGHQIAPKKSLAKLGHRI